MKMKEKKHLIKQLMVLEPYSKTLECISEREKESRYKGYPRDATQFAFQRHVLVLLQKIAGNQND